MFNDVITTEHSIGSEIQSITEKQTQSIVDQTFNVSESMLTHDDIENKPDFEMIVENKISTKEKLDTVSKNNSKDKFNISFTKENLELAGNTALYADFSKFSNEIFTNIFKANKKDDITGEFLLDTITGVPTDDKMKWESAYALQQLNFGINSKHQKFIQRDIKDCKYTYFYDSDGDGKFEHEIGFDKDNKVNFIKLVNKNPEFKEIVSIENCNNTALKIITKEGEIIEKFEDMHIIQAGFNKIEIKYDEEGKVKTMECIEELKTEPISMLEATDTPSVSYVVSSDTIEPPEANSNEAQDDLASLAQEINSEKSSEINIIE